MRKSTRIVLTCIALVVCLMVSFASVNMVGLRVHLQAIQTGSADAAPEEEANGPLAPAQDLLPLTARSLIAAALITVGMALIVWIMLDKKPKVHLAALVLLLTAGALIALCKPAMGWYSWDEETHYAMMQTLIGSSTMSFSDRIEAFTLWDLGYLPTLFGMGVSRVLRLGDIVEYKLGVLVNTIVYAVMCSLAVKHAPKYKLSFLAIALIPSALFQAASCTYDGMVIASVMLAVALLMETCMTEGKMSALRGYTMAALLCLGTVSKPVYSLLLLLLLAIPKDRFESPKQAVAWRVFIIILTVWSLLSLLMPGTYDNVKNGDDRYHGADSRQQLQFILQNPGEALQIFTDYIRNSWVNVHIGHIVTWGFAGHYLEVRDIFAVGILLVCPLCVIGEDDRPSPLKAGRRISMLIFETLVLLILTITQFMVSTGVGEHAIQGMQARYSIPVWILLALGLMLPEKVRRFVRPAGNILGSSLMIALAGITYAVAACNLFIRIGV